MLIIPRETSSAPHYRHLIKQESAPSPYGFFHLKKCDVHLDNQAGVFGIQTKIIIGDVEKPGRKYVLKAKDENERHGWVSTIRDFQFKVAKARLQKREEDKVRRECGLGVVFGEGGVTFSLFFSLSHSIAPSSLIFHFLCSFLRNFIFF